MVTTTDYNTLVTSATNIRSTSLHCIEESGTGSLHIKAKGALQSAIAYYQRGRRGKMIVGRCGCTDYQLYAIRVCTSLAQKLLYGTGHHIRGATTLLRFQDVTSFHTYAFHNPLVRGINDSRHLLIIQNVIRNISSNACYNGINLFHYLSIYLQ